MPQHAHAGQSHQCHRNLAAGSLTTQVQASFVGGHGVRPAAQRVTGPPDEHVALCLQAPISGLPHGQLGEGEGILQVAPCHSRALEGGWTDVPRDGDALGA